MFARDTCALPSTYGQSVSMFGGSKSSMTSSEQQQDDVTPNDRYQTTESGSQHLHQPQQPGTNKVSALHRVANMLKEKLSREDGRTAADVTGHSQSVDVKIEHSSSSSSNNNNNTMKETDSSSNDRDIKIKQSKDGASDEEEEMLEAGEDEDIEENGSLEDNEDEEDGADRHGDAMESSAVCPPLMPASAASFEEMLLRENAAAAEFYRRAAAGAATNGDADGRQVTGDVRRPKRKQYIPQQHDATREHQRRLERSILQRQLTLMQQQLSQMQKRYMELLEREEEETGDGDGENMAGDNCSDNNDMPVDMGDSDEHEDEVKVIDVDEMDDEDADTRQAKRQQQQGDCTSDGISPPRKKLCAEGDEGHEGYRSKTDENGQEHLTAASSSPIPAGGIGAGMPVASAARSDKQPRLWSLLDIANRADPARFSALSAAAGSAFSIVHDRLAPAMLGRQPGSDLTLPSTTGGVAKQQVSPTVGDTPADFQQLASVLKDEITSGISTIVESAVAKYAEKQQTVRHHRKDVIGHMTSASLLRHHPHHHRDTSDIVNHHESASVSSDRNLLQHRDNVDTKVPPLILDTGRLTSASESASTSTTAKSLPWPASAKSPKKDFSSSTAAAVSATSSKPSSSSTLLGSQLFGDDFDSSATGGGGGALSDMRKHYMDLVRGPAKLHPPSFLPPHHPAFDFLHHPPVTAAGFDLVRAAGLGPAPFSMPYFPPLHIPPLPSMYGKEPEQTEALPLIVNTPKKKRTKVTDTRLSPRAARALLHEPAGPLRTSSGTPFDFPFGGHTSVAGNHHHYHGGHHAPSTSSSHRRSPGEMSDSRPRSNPSLSSHVINDLSPDAAAGLFPGRGYPFSHSNLSLSGGLQPTDVFSALYKHHAAAAVKDQRSPYLPFSSVLGIDGGKRESESPRSGEGRRGGDSLLQQQLADDSDLFEQDASSSESYTITSTLTPMHLRKAKLMFFYVRYPSSSILKVYFPDVKFNKNNTAQLVKWFSNFREFYYIQMEKYSRQALAEGVKMAEELVVTTDSELYRVLNLHYNRNNQIEVPDNFRLVVQLTLREFFKAIQAGKDLEQSWKKAIYKVIARADDQIPDFFKSPNWMEMLAEN